MNVQSCQAVDRQFAPYLIANTIVFWKVFKIILIIEKCIYSLKYHKLYFIKILLIDSHLNGNTEVSHTQT